MARFQIGYVPVRDTIQQKKEASIRENGWMLL